MLKYLSIIILAAISLSSCSEENEDLVKEPNKDGAIETIINVAHENGFDILKTTHKIWLKGAIDKEIVTSDTLKLLGTEAKDVEDENGDEKNVIAPKDYELYITVK
jgi:hypothetical protein